MAEFVCKEEKRLKPNQPGTQTIYGEEREDESIQQHLLRCKAASETITNSRPDGDEQQQAEHFDLGMHHPTAAPEVGAAAF